MKINKVSVIGAGQVGSNTAFLLLIAGVCQKVVLVDIQEGLAEGLALDLEDSRFFLGSDAKIEGSANLEAAADSDIIVITAGRPRSPGMSREDLIKTNASIVKDISKRIKVLSPDSIVIVITNPLDLMTYVVLKNTEFCWQKVIGMGSGLDSSRLANILSKRLPVSINLRFLGPMERKCWFLPSPRLKAPL